MAAAENTGELLTGRAIVGLGIGELNVFFKKIIIM
jgi:hypothetical protein